MEPSFWNSATFLINFSLTKSPERGKQVKCIAFHKSGIRVESEMRGYNGPWSHLELAFPLESVDDMEKFIKKVAEFQKDGSKQESLL
ncbi:hypothetical protein ES703_119848 [subsurface metagenome]